MGVGFEAHVVMELEKDVVIERQSIVVIGRGTSIAIGQGDGRFKDRSSVMWQIWQVNVGRSQRHWVG